MKPNLYILNSIEEFEDCKNDITKGDQIIYTSELLGLQLKKIGCECIFESIFKHLSVEDINTIKYTCLDKCYEISQKLDSDLADDLKKEFGHSFSVYRPFVYYSSVIIANVKILSKIVNLKKDTKKILGVVNITNDSFSNDGLLGHREQLITNLNLYSSLNIHFLDVGCVSTKPGYTEVSTAQELQRLQFFISNYKLNIQKNKETSTMKKNIC